MDFELIVKAAVAIFGAIAPAKLIYEWMNSDRGRIREDFNFARTRSASVKARADSQSKCNTTPKLVG